MPINLLPWRQQRAYQMKLGFWLGCATIFAVITLMASSYYYHSHRQIAQLQQQSNQLQQLLQKTIIAHSKQEYLNAQRQIHLAITQRQQLHDLLALLYDSSQSLPKQLAFTLLEWKAPLLILHGMSYSNAALNRWIQQLSENKYIQQIKPSYQYIASRDPLRHDFSIEITLKSNTSTL